jgi:flagellar hook-length control protein FliK
MTALSVPANILSPTKPAEKAKPAQQEAETPFSSVLQQKVESGKGSQDKQSEMAAANGSNGTEASQHAPADNRETTEPLTAMALASGEYAQTALQQLLPWLQAMQGQNGKSNATIETELSGETSLLPQADIQTGAQAVVQTTGVLPVQRDISEEGPRKGAAQAEILDPKQQAAAQTADDAANLAAASDVTRTKDAAAMTGVKDSFDSSLQNANERINLQAQAATSATSATTSRGEVVRLQAPLGTPQWQNELGDRVQFMSRHNESRAELVLTPPQLGRIEVSLNINGDQATALFVSANPEVRTALEGAMDRLREMLANNGIALGQAHVGAESSGQSAAGNEGDGRRQTGNLAGNANNTTTEAATAGTAWTRHNNNMLDVFA